MKSWLFRASSLSYLGKKMLSLRWKCSFACVLIPQLLLQWGKAVTGLLRERHMNIPYTSISAFHKSSERVFGWPVFVLISPDKNSSTRTVAQGELKEGRFRLDQILGRNSLLNEWWGTGCLEKLLALQPWRQSKPGWALWKVSLV